MNIDDIRKEQTDYVARLTAIVADIQIQNGIVEQNARGALNGELLSVAAISSAQHALVQLRNDEHQLSAAITDCELQIIDLENAQHREALAAQFTDLDNLAADVEKAVAQALKAGEKFAQAMRTLNEINITSRGTLKDPTCCANPVHLNMYAEAFCKYIDLTETVLPALRVSRVNVPSEMPRHPIMNGVERRRAMIARELELGDAK